MLNCDRILIFTALTSKSWERLTESEAAGETKSREKLSHYHHKDILTGGNEHLLLKDYKMMEQINQ